MDCAFTLMTVSDGRATPAPAPAATNRVQSKVTKAPEPSQTTLHESTQGRRESNNMPPPPVPSTRRPLGRNKPPGSAAPSQNSVRQDIDPDSLFIPQQDDDREWDPQNVDDGETLQWDASANAVRILRQGRSDTLTLLGKCLPCNLQGHSKQCKDALRKSRRGNRAHPANLAGKTSCGLLCSRGINITNPLTDRHHIYTAAHHSKRSKRLSRTLYCLGSSSASVPR